VSQTVQRQTNQTSAWLMSSGAVVGVLGAIVKKHAATIGELIGLRRVGGHLGPLAVHSPAGLNSDDAGRRRPIGR
jgi:hypothetical protein